MLLRALQNEERAITTGEIAWWPDRVQSNTWAGVRVSTESALQLLTVYGCVKLITETISTLPVDCYTKSGDESRPIPLPSWLKQPTPELEWGPWCTQVLSSLLLAGNAWVEVLRNERAGIVGLVPLDPAVVQVIREGGRRVVYVNGRRHTGELVHIPAMMLPGSDVGLSPLELARQTIGLGIAAQEFGSRQFDSDLNMPGVIEMPGSMPPEQKRETAQMWRRNRSKQGKGLPGILDGGATWKPTGVTNEQAQFLETRRYTDAQIAGQLFLVDPSELGIAVDGTSLTYQNLESRNIRLVQRTLLPWIIRLEHAMSELMFSPRYVKLNVSGLLRGDMKARWDTYFVAAGINKIASETGMPPVMTTGEMRGFEDWNPIEPAGVAQEVQDDTAS